jgi:hypothetical protein
MIKSERSGGRMDPWASAEADLEAAEAYPITSAEHAALVARAQVYALLNVGWQVSGIGDQAAEGGSYVADAIQSATSEVIKAWTG